MKRKNGFIILSVIFLLLLFMITASANEGIRVYLDGELLNFEVPPMVKDERTLVPMRTIFEKLGATVEWEQTTQTAKATKDSISVGITIGSGKMMRIDSDKAEVYNLDVPAMAVNGRTLIPLRAVSEAFLCEVEWDGRDKTIYIDTEKNNPDSINEDQLLYSYGVLSDLHLDTNTSDLYNSNSVAKFQNALEFFNSYGCKYTFIAGDITDNGKNSEFEKYVEIRDKYKGNMQVFAVTGNHEASSSKTYSSKLADSNCIAYNIYNKIGNHLFYYIENGKYTYWNLSEGNYTTETAETITIEDPSIVLPENDVYIFLGILGDGGGFWNESLQWIYETFEKNKDKRCFVFEHLRAEYAESTVNGVMTNDIYSSYVSGNQTGLYLKPMWGHGKWYPATHTLESLFAHYTNIVWFHGHSHHSADTSKYEGFPRYSVGNVDSHFGNAYETSNPSASANNTKWTWSVHVPATVEMREAVDGSLYRNKNHSEGLIVDVYANKIVLKYVTFTNNKGVTFINKVMENSIETLDTTLDRIRNYIPPNVMVRSKETTIIKPISK